MAFLTLAQFRTRFPEFASTDADLVQAKLDDAEEDIDEDVWGDATAKGHGWLTAHLLSSTSYGKEVSKDGTTSYGRRYEEMQRRVGTAYRVVLNYDE